MSQYPELMCISLFLGGTRLDNIYSGIRRIIMISRMFSLKRMNYTVLMFSIDFFPKIPEINHNTMDDQKNGNWLMWTPIATPCVQAR